MITISRIFNINMFLDWVQIFYFPNQLIFLIDFFERFVNTIETNTI